MRQSTYVQVERLCRESTARQYDLVATAIKLGWPRSAVMVIDEDLGISASGVTERTGFARLVAEVGLGHVGIVLGLEASRLARNNSDWYRLVDLCGITDTLIGDGDGVYHPARLDDRIVLGLKGQMSEALFRDRDKASYSAHVVTPTRSGMAALRKGSGNAGSA